MLEYDRAWNAEFHAAMYGGQVASLDQAPLTKYSKSDILFRRFTGPRLTRSQIRAAWLELPLSSRLPLWQKLMLWCLQRSPSRALQLLIASMEGTYIPVSRHVAAECMATIAAKYLSGSTKPSLWTVNALLSAVNSYLDRGRGARMILTVPSAVCYLLFKHCKGPQFLSLLHKFRQTGVQSHRNTLLQALDRSIANGNVPVALQLLKAVTQCGPQVSDLPIQKACAKLVRVRFDSPDQFAFRMNIVADILGMGIRPNLIVHKAIQFNAFEDGEPKFALQIFYAMIDSGIRPDSFIYHILLQGAMGQLSQAHVRTLIRMVEHDEALLDDRDLPMTVLRAISGKEGNSYGMMLRFYKRHWDLKPLKELGICGAFAEPPLLRQDSVAGKLPEPAIVSLMICAFLKAHRKSAGITEVYSRYQALVRNAHPLVQRVGQTDHVANAFLMCLGRNPLTLSVCATVVRDMLDASRSQRLSFKPEQTGSAASPPTALTWSILAASYFRHGQKHAAIKVLELMRERGIERQQFTWDIIIGGFTSLQDVNQTVNTILEMDEAGARVSKRAMRNLRKLEDKEQLIAAFHTAMSCRPGGETSTSITDRNGNVKAISDMMMARMETERAVDGKTGRLQNRYHEVRKEAAEARE